MALGISTNVYSDYAEKLHSIEEELHAQPITGELREQIIQELNEVHTGISQLETTAARVDIFAQQFVARLRQQAIFLYGEIDSYFYKHELEVIEQETKLLALTLQLKDVSRIDALKGHINKLLESHSPLLTERRVLVLARLVLEQAEAILAGREIQEITINEWSYLQTEEIIEEIAEYLGNNDRQGVKDLWRGLSPFERKLVLAYLNPNDLLCFLHDIEGAADKNTFSLRKSSSDAISDRKPHRKTVMTQHAAQRNG
jgi:hypothetical protein